MSAFTSPSRRVRAAVAALLTFAHVCTFAAPSYRHHVYVNGLRVTQPVASAPDAGGGGGTGTTPGGSSGGGTTTPGTTGAGFMLLSANSISFGGVNAGETSAPRSVQISNIGSGPLTLSAPVFQGGAYEVSTNCPASLPAGSNCAVTAVFKPVAEGEATAQVTLTSSSGSSTVLLAGVGMVPLTAQVSKDFSSAQTHDGAFPVTLLGSSSTRTVFVLAQGNIDLLSINASLSGSPDYKFVGISRISPYYQGGAGMQYYSGDCAGTMADRLVTGCSAGPGYLGGPLFKHVALTVRYTPSAAGSSAATLSIAHNGTNTSPLTLNLSGQGQGVATPVLSTNALTWSETNSLTLVGGSTTQTVRLTNQGTADVVLPNPPSILGNAAFTAGTSCGTYLPPNQHCDVTVTFAPTTTSVVTGQLVFSTNNGVHVTGLSGQGFTRSATLPDTNVGSVLVGQSSTADVTLTNTGTLPLTVTTPTSSSVSGAGFSFVSTTCGSTLAVNSNCAVTVRYSAASGGSASGALSVTTSAGVLNAVLTASGAVTYMDATGGTVTTSGNYRVHTFTTNGTFSISRVPSTSEVEVLVVGGGGGGAGGGLQVGGGGGGAGGYVALTPSVTSTGTVSVTVGAAGAGGAYNGQGTSGGNSAITGVLGTYTAIGGGRGGTAPNSAASGGSGGGHSGAGGTPGAGTAGQGFAGAAGTGTYGYTVATGGGGGGAGAAAAGGTGGAGKASTISGTNVTYAMGGNGGATSGGNGAARTGNFGHGGNGGNGTNASGSAGSAGVVIIRYRFQ